MNPTLVDLTLIDPGNLCWKSTLATVRIQLIVNAFLDSDSLFTHFSLTFLDVFFGSPIATSSKSHLVWDSRGSWVGCNYRPICFGGRLGVSHGLNRFLSLLLCCCLFATWFAASRTSQCKKSNNIRDTVHSGQAKAWQKCNLDLEELGPSHWMWEFSVVDEASGLESTLSHWMLAEQARMLAGYNNPRRTGELDIRFTNMLKTYKDSDPVPTSEDEFWCIVINLLQRIMICRAARTLFIFIWPE